MAPFPSLDDTPHREANANNPAYWTIWWPTMPTAERIVRVMLLLLVASILIGCACRCSRKTTEKATMANNGQQLSVITTTRHHSHQSNPAGTFVSSSHTSELTCLPAASTQASSRPQNDVASHRSSQDDMFTPPSSGRTTPEPASQDSRPDVGPAQGWADLPPVYESHDSRKSAAGPLGKHKQPVSRCCIFASLSVWDVRVIDRVNQSKEG